MMKRCTLFTSLLALGFISTARANLLINGGLEKDATTPLNTYNLLTLSPTLNNTALPGWSVTTGTVDIVPNTYWQVSEGSYSVDLVGTPGLGGIAQSVATVAGTSYTLIFDMAANPEAGPYGEHGTTKILRVEALRANGTTILAQDFSLTAGTRTTQDMQWVTNAFVFNATDATTTIRLSALTPPNLPAGTTSSIIFTGPVVDNFDLFYSSGTVPEPASLSVLGLGGAALLRRRRRAGA
jgi:choice-of-anchor C domain-containing protein